METVHTFTQTDRDTRASGSRTKNMGTGATNIKTETTIMAAGRMITVQDRARCTTTMGHLTWADGRKASSTAAECLPFPQETVTTGSG